MNATTACPRCGAALSVDDYQLPSCRYCGAVHAHVARAQEKVAVVQGLLGDANRNGIPDALEGMMGNMAPQGAVPQGAVVHVSHAAWVVGPSHVGGPGVSPFGGPGVAPSPPAMGGPMGAGGVVHAQPPMNPYAPMGPMADTHQRARRLMLIVTLAIFGVSAVIAAAVILLVVS